MKVSKIRSLVAAVALTFGAVGAANALAISSGNYKFTIDNYDSGTTGYGDSLGSKCTSASTCDVAASAPAPGSINSINTSADTMGIFSVAVITNSATGAVVFTKGVNGYLTGVFGNLTDINVSVVNNPFNHQTTTIANATGGTFELFENTKDYSPLGGPKVSKVTDLNNNMYPGITDGTASLYLKGYFAPGTFSGDPLTTYQSIFANAGFSGSGAGFIDLTGGSAYSLFNTKSLGGHDLFLTTTFDDINGSAAANGYTVLSAGQVQGSAPEPGSMALLAMGGLVAGFATRRRKLLAK